MTKDEYKDFFVKISFQICQLTGKKIVFPTVFENEAFLLRCDNGIGRFPIKTLYITWDSKLPDALLA